METVDFEKELVILREKLLSYAFLLFPKKEDAEDLIQETFLKALEHRDKYNENVNFKGWLYTIMHNTFVNICKSKRNCMCQNISDSEIRAEIDKSVEEFIDDSFGIEEIYKVINRLPDDYRVVILMRLAGFRYQEIADKMGIPITLVKSRIFYGKRKLKKYAVQFQINESRQRILAFMVKILSGLFL